MPAGLFITINSESSYSISSSPFSGIIFDILSFGTFNWMDCPELTFLDGVETERPLCLGTLATISVRRGQNQES